MEEKNSNTYVKYLTECIDMEDKYADYSYSINGVPVYGIIRRYIRGLYCKGHGVNGLNEIPINKKKLLFNLFVSFFHFISLFLKRKKYKYLIYSFFRTDKIGDVYIDKFTDPIIDNSNVKDSYIIFEHSKGGGHKRPRIHSKHVIYTDLVDAYSVLAAKCYAKIYKKKFKKEFEHVWNMTDSILGDIHYNRDFILLLFLRFYIKSKIYEKIFKRLNIKYLIAPARPVFLEQLYSAKKNGIKVFEIQHGVLSSIGISYSGHIDEPFTPDYFLSYGELHHPEFYGIPQSRIVNIGWALPLYFENISTEKSYNENDVLVVLNPLTSKYVIDITMDLAEKNKTIVFHLRPHPTESIPIEIIQKINTLDNVILQDNSLNFSYVLYLFKNIIGDNSTAMNEAFSEGKKVGRLCYPGLVPLYINSEEEEKTWRVYDDSSFKSFLAAKPFENIDTRVYSNFDRIKVDDLLGE